MTPALSPLPEGCSASRSSGRRSASGGEPVSDQTALTVQVANAVALVRGLP